MAERSRGGGERRQSMNVKILPSLRERLDTVAEQSGRSLGHEVERRLEASFEASPIVANDRTARLLDAIRKSIEMAEAMASVGTEPESRTWATDAGVSAQAKRAVMEVLRVMMGEADSGMFVTLRRTDGTEVENFDFSKAIAHTVLMNAGELAREDVHHQISSGDKQSNKRK